MGTRRLRPDAGYLLRVCGYLARSIGRLALGKRRRTPGGDTGHLRLGTRCRTRLAPHGGYLLPGAWWRDPWCRLR